MGHGPMRRVRQLREASEPDALRASPGVNGVYAASMRLRSWSFSALSALMLVAGCASDAPADGPTEGDEEDLSLSKLLAVATGKVDRSRPDPNNPWAKRVTELNQEGFLDDEETVF